MRSTRFACYPKFTQIWTHLTNIRDFSLNCNIIKEAHVKEVTYCISWAGSVDGFGFTHLALLDAGVDGVEKVRPVLVTFGQLGKFFPQQFTFVVAHHPFEGWVDILWMGSGYGSGQDAVCLRNTCQGTENVPWASVLWYGSRWVPQPQWVGSLLTSNVLIQPPSQHPGPSGNWKKFFSSKNSKKPLSTSASFQWALFIPHCPWKKEKTKKKKEHTKIN